MAATCLVTVLMVHTGYDLLARTLWILVSTLSIVIGYFVIHPAANVQVLLIAVTGGPFILFSVKDSPYMQYFINMAGAEEELYKKWKEITLNSTGSDQVSLSFIPGILSVLPNTVKSSLKHSILSFFFIKRQSIAFGIIL